MSLPHLRKTVMLRFWSLRNGIGESGGVILDIDTQVERECYRVRKGESWKWQIKGLNRLPVWDKHHAEVDQECLDNIENESDWEIVK